MSTGTAYEDRLPLIANTTPVSLPRPFLVKLLAERFRSAAAEWRKAPAEIGVETPRDVAVSWTQRSTRCGELIIDAFRAGLVPDVADSHKLIAWHLTDGNNDLQHPLPRYVRCPGNLFTDFVGGVLVAVRLEGGATVVTGPEFGGIAPRLDPRILTLPVNERCAAGCELLADLIETAVNIEAASDNSAAPRIAADEAEGPSTTASGKRGDVAVKPASRSGQPAIDDERMVVSHLGVECRFPPRRVLLFTLLKRLLVRPGRRVSVATLCGDDGPWADREVRDSTIRGAVSRLRAHLRSGNLSSLAKAICTLSEAGHQYAMYEPGGLEAPPPAGRS